MNGYKVVKFEDRESWLIARRGKITGSRLKDIVVERGNGKKLGFYELIAERIAIEADGEDAMERGSRLEKEVIARFEKETKKKVKTDLVIWMREDNESIAVSPDGTIGKTEALEAKCLASARHIQAYLTQEVPKDYEMQVLQYFIVNSDLEKLYMAFYDPRVPCIEFFYITITREALADRIEYILDYEMAALKEVNEIVTRLTF